MVLSNNNVSFKFKQETRGQTGNDTIKDVEIMLPLKYLSCFWRTLELPLINCEINFILTWLANCLLVTSTITNQIPTFTITETKLYETKHYVPVVTLSTLDNAKLSTELKSGFKKWLAWTSINQT